MPLCAQVRGSGNLGVPFFEEDFAFFPGDSFGKSNLEVYLRIPQNKLQFLKISDGYIARIDVLVALLDGNRLVMRTDRADSVYAEEYYDAHSTEIFVPKAFVLRDLDPGKFTLRMTMKDRESRNEHTRTSEIVIPRFDTKNRVEFSSIVPVENAEYRRASAYPAIGVFEYEFEISVPENIFGEVICKILYSEDDLAETTSISEHGKHRIKGWLPVSNEIAEFVFSAEFFSEGKSLAKTEKQITLVRTGYRKNTSNDSEAVEQLDLIGTGKEMRELRKALNAKSDALDSLIEAFWQERDPTPETEINEVREEFYRRTEIANERYGGYRSGWSTSRGRIFILYGEPDEIERRPFDLQYRAHEVWYYYNPRRTFYFEDRIGDGTYELIYQE
jgi:GWxTD domain-containing protein